LIHYQFLTWCKSLVTLEKKRIWVALCNCSFKSFEVLNVFFDMFLNKIMTFRFDFQNFKKFNDHNFHT
jgi:hypothetical protein